jgi:hypothetical protein
VSRDPYVSEQINAVKKNSDLIVLGLLWITSMTTIFAVFFTTYILPTKTYLGIGGLVILTTWRVIRRKDFKIFLAVFLLLGCIGLIQFSFVTSGLYWGKSDDPFLQFHYGPLSIVLLLFLIALNVDSISKMHKVPDEEIEKRSSQSTAYLDKYYNELKEKETIYLQQILSTRERWQKEYIEAAEKLVEERK